MLTGSSPGIRLNSMLRLNGTRTVNNPGKAISQHTKHRRNPGKKEYRRHRQLDKVGNIADGIMKINRPCHH